MCVLYLSPAGARRKRYPSSGRISVSAPDCMQKAFDTMNNGAFPYGDMMMNIRPEDLKNMTSICRISA